MKNLLAGLAVLAIVGAGCPRADEAAKEPTVRYENAEFGFSLEHATTFDVKERGEAIRSLNYLGLDASYFATLRDTQRGEKPENIAAFYAVPKMTKEAFEEALKKSGTTAGEPTAEILTVNRLTVTKVSNATDFGTDKVHYLLDRGDKTLVISVYVGEDGPFDPVFKSLKGS